MKNLNRKRLRVNGTFTANCLMCILIRYSHVSQRHRLCRRGTFGESSQPPGLPVVLFGGFVVHVWPTLDTVPRACVAHDQISWLALCRNCGSETHVVTTSLRGVVQHGKPGNRTFPLQTRFFSRDGTVRSGSYGEGSWHRSKGGDVKVVVLARIFVLFSRVLIHAEGRA